MWKEVLEQSSSPSASPEVKSRDEQRREYYRDNQERIEANNKLINDYNANRYSVFSDFKTKVEQWNSEYYIHLFNNANNRWQLSYSFGIDQMKKFDEWSAKTKEIPFLEKINIWDKSSYDELTKKFSDEQFKAIGLQWKSFNFTENDQKFGFTPSIKNLMLLRTSESFMWISHFTSIHRTYLFTLNNIQIPSKPENKQPETKKKQSTTKTETAPKQKTVIVQDNTTIDLSKKQSIDLTHKNIKEHPELSYTYIHIHKDAKWLEKSKTEKYYIINNNWDVKEVNKDAYIDYKIAVLRRKEQDRDISIFTFFTKLYPQHSSIFSN